MAPSRFAVQRNVQFVDAQPSGVFALTVSLRRLIARAVTTLLCGRSIPY